MCVWLKVFSLTGKSKLSTYISEYESFPPCPPCVLIDIIYAIKEHCSSSSVHHCHLKNGGRLVYTDQPLEHAAKRLLCSRTHKEP